MTQHVLLNNIDHKDLRVITDRSVAMGDAVMNCVTFPNEFRNLQAHYPILFQKDTDSGSFQAIALLGLERGENLFLTDKGWNAHYIPMVLEMQPFLIGTQQRPGEAPEQVVHIDMSSPRISETQGQPVFLPQGGNTPFLEYMAGLLEQVHIAASANAAFYQTVDELGLLEPFALDMELKDGRKSRLSGFYTVNEEKLYGLEAASLGALNEKGFLQPLFMAVASLSNLRDLIERKNLRLQE